jgi:hypothetical protein
MNSSAQLRCGYQRGTEIAFGTGGCHRAIGGLKPFDAERGRWNSNALALKASGKFAQALESYNHCLELDDRPQYRSNRGVLLQEMGRLDEALADHDRALAAEPTYAQGHYNRGNALQALNRLEDALCAYDTCIALLPSFAPAYSNKADALRDLGRFDVSLASYEQALSLAPDLPDARFNRALVLLLLGQFEEGLSHYEWRWSRGDLQRHKRAFDRPLWLGQEGLCGNTILLHAEQGLGDTLQFCRYAQMVSALGARVILECPRALAPLLKSLPGVDILMAAGDALPPFDFHCPLASLPLAFKTRLDCIPTPIPYLYPQPERIRQWSQGLGQEGLRIGVCWQGQPSQVDQGRSFPLKMLKPLSEIPGVRLISLHKGSGEGQLQDLPPGMTVQSLGPNLDEDGAFLDTAAVMKHCHLVITSDTSIAHLAGALGVPVWVALKFVPDWRWMLHRSDSPWYPTMRLFRQSAPGDWGPVFAAMAAELGSGLRS